MRLKENFTYEFGDTGTLDVYNLGQHVLHQPFDSDDGGPFTDVDDALAWLLKYFPDYFTP